jgi:hypothetical protein
MPSKSYNAVRRIRNKLRKKAKRATAQASEETTTHAGPQQMSELPADKALVPWKAKRFLPKQAVCGIDQWFPGGSRFSGFVHGANSSTQRQHHNDSEPKPKMLNMRERLKLMEKSLVWMDAAFARELVRQRRLPRSTNRTFCCCKPKVGI